MFIKLALTVVWLQFISACATGPQIVGVYEDENKNWKAKADHEVWNEKAESEIVLRDEKGQLIANRTDAEQAVKKYKNYFDLKELSFSCGTENTFEASKKYYSGLNKLQLNQFTEALAEWEQASEYCKNLGDFSLLHYVKAKAFLGLKNDSMAREELKKFVSRSATVTPVNFYQENQQSLLFYKNQAESFLNNTTQNLDLEEAEINKIAKMDPNTFFSPGGNRQEFTFILPIFSTRLLGGRHESLFGISYLKSWGEWSINPAIFNSTSLGSLMSLSIKKNIYESPSRDLDVSTWLRLSQWKQAVLIYNEGSQTAQVENLSQGYNTYLGIGLTKRLNPLFSTHLASYLINDTFDNKVKLQGDLYINYELNDLFSFYAGSFGGDSVSGVGLFQIMMFGYNLTQKLVDVRIYGFVF